MTPTSIATNGYLDGPSGIATQGFVVEAISLLPRLIFLQSGSNQLLTINVGGLKIVVLA